MNQEQNHLQLAVRIKDMGLPDHLVDTIRKSVFAIHVVPMGKRLTLRSRKLVYALSCVAGKQFSTLPEDVRERIMNSIRTYISDFRQGKIPDVPPILEGPRFTAKLSDLAVLVGTEAKNARQMQDDLDILLETIVRFNVFNHGAAGDEKELFPHELKVSTTFLSSILNNGKGYISWGYDPLIFAIMVDPRTYAKLSMHVMYSASTYASIALYENVKRFVDQGYTPNFPIRRWQELLADDGKVPEWETNAEFRKKIKRTIQSLESNEGCDIDIEPIESKVAGSRERQLQFKVSLRRQDLLKYGTVVPQNQALRSMLQAIGFSGEDMTLLAHSYDDDMIFSKIQMMRRQPNVINEKAWLKAALEKDFTDKEEIERKRRIEEQRRLDIQENRRRQEESFKLARRAYIKSKLETMDPGEVADYREQYALTKTEASRAGERILKLSPEREDAAFVAWLNTLPDFVEDPTLGDLASFILGQAET